MFFKTKVVVLLLLLTFPTLCAAQTIDLYKKGTTLKLTEDLHCMDDNTALLVIKKLELCPKACELRLKETKKLLEVDIELLRDKLVLQEKEHSDIIFEKDKTLSRIQVEAVDEMDKISGSIWWKVTLGVLGGIAVGAGTTFLVMKYAK